MFQLSVHPSLCCFKYLKISRRHLTNHILSRHLARLWFRIVFFFLSWLLLQPSCSFMTVWFGLVCVCAFLTWPFLYVFFSSGHSPYKHKLTWHDIFSLFYFFTVAVVVIIDPLRWFWSHHRCTLVIWLDAPALYLSNTISLYWVVRWTSQSNVVKIIWCWIDPRFGKGKEGSGRTWHSAGPIPRLVRFSFVQSGGCIRTSTH